MQRWVRERLLPGQTPEQWNQILREATQIHFPAQAKTARPTQDTLAARRLWRSRKPGPEATQEELEAHALLVTQHRQAVTQTRKAKAAEFLAEVDASIHAGDQHLAYQALKKLKPWAPALKAQLKNEKGFLLSPEEELQELGKFAKKVFAAHPPLAPNTGQFPSLSTTQLAKHISSIKPGKAVPKGAAPAATWKQCADEVAGALTAYFQDTTPAAGLDEGLLNADLCLIPKPGKASDKPSQLRPLGILRPDAKGLAGTAKELLQPLITPYMLPLPQFAYLPQRGLSDAQSRVVQHLREVRDLCRAAKPSRVDLSRGHCPPALVGGIVFALDFRSISGL